MFGLPASTMLPYTHSVPYLAPLYHNGVMYPQSYPVAMSPIAMSPIAPTISQPCNYPTHLTYNSHVNTYPNSIGSAPWPAYNPVPAVHYNPLLSPYTPYVNSIPSNYNDVLLGYALANTHANTHGINSIGNNAVGNNALGSGVAPANPNTAPNPSSSTTPSTTPAASTPAAAAPEATSVTVGSVQVNQPNNQNSERMVMLNLNDAVLRMLFSSNHDNDDDDDDDDEGQDILDVEEYIALFDLREHTKVELYSNNSSFENKCSICQDEYGQNDIVRILRCKHAFHMRCVDQALEDTIICPLCRTPVIPPEPTIQDESEDGSEDESDN